METNQSGGINDSWLFKIAGLPNDANQELKNIHHNSSSNKVCNYIFFCIFQLPIRCDHN